MNTVANDLRPDPSFGSRADGAGLSVVDAGHSVVGVSKRGGACRKCTKRCVIVGIRVADGNLNGALLDKIKVIKCLGGKGDSLYVLEEEYVEIDDIKVPACKKDELDEDDMFTFWYE